MILPFRDSRVLPPSCRGGQREATAVFPKGLSVGTTYDGDVESAFLPLGPPTNPFLAVGGRADISFRSFPLGRRLPCLPQDILSLGVFRLPCHHPSPPSCVGVHSTRERVNESLEGGLRIVHAVSIGVDLSFVKPVSVRRFQTNPTLRRVLRGWVLEMR